MRKIIFLVASLLISVWPVLAPAALTIEITQGMDGAVPIAIVPFAQPASGARPPEDVSQIVMDDLRRSGRFDPVPEQNLVSRPSAPEQVRFQDWKTLGVENLVIGQVEPAGPDRYNIKFFLFDVYRGKKLIGFSVPTTRKRMRYDAHRVSDLIFEKLTGLRGAFATRIAYVTEKKSAGKRQFKLEVSDSDGHNPKTILSSRDPLMSPAWSSDGKQLAYVSFEKHRSSIFAQNIQTAKRRKLASFEGVNGAPAWSPDGSRLALTLSRDGNPEIYVYTLSSGEARRITRNVAIDTEPVWSPDGRDLVFTSDRGGSPQLYRVSASGGRAERLTFEGKYNASADFSADGKRLAMVHGAGGNYRIAILELDTGIFNVVSDGRLDESPSFAPNGSMIIYATESGGKGVLAAVSSDGRFRQRFSSRGGDVREPVWSPFDKAR